MDGSNVTLGAIQRILGRENRKTTEIYLHSLGDLERQAMAIYEQAKKIHTKIHTKTWVQKKRGFSVAT